MSTFRNLAVFALLVAGCTGGAGTPAVVTTDGDAGAAVPLAVTLPALSSTVHAAPPVAYTTITVHQGQTLWTLAEAETAPTGDVQATVDQIIATNHLATANLRVGQNLRVPR